MCEDTIFATTAEMILYEPSNSITCTDTEEYRWKLDNICEVDVVFTCETVYGTPIDFNAIPLS